MPFARFAVSGFFECRPDWLCACSMSATTPLVTPVAMLDPLMARSDWPLFAVTWLVLSNLYRYDETLAADVRLWPGATTSGLANASNHAGPRELYGATTSSSRVVVFRVIAAPTVIADGALPGDVIPV